MTETLTLKLLAAVGWIFFLIGLLFRRGAQAYEFDLLRNSVAVLREEIQAQENAFNQAQTNYLNTISELQTANASQQAQIQALQQQTNLSGVTSSLALAVQKLDQIIAKLDVLNME